MSMGMDGVLSVVNPKSAAHVLIDRIVLGTRPEPPEKRTQAYERLHKAHEEHPERTPSERCSTSLTMKD
jgi:hypothetical protein